jgi:hypothetical protein
LAGLLLLSCDRKATVETFPSAAAPGQTIQVHLGSFKGNPDNLRVMVGDQPGRIVQRHQNMLEVVLPSVKEDSVTLAVFDDNRQLAQSSFYMLAPASLRLLLWVSNDSVRLIRALASNHAPTGLAATQRTRLSFDVITNQNIVVYSGSIPHPKTRPPERFAQSDTVSATGGLTDLPDSAVVSIFIPMPQDSVRIDFYEAGPGLNLLTNADRALRGRINQLRVGP